MLRDLYTPEGSHEIFDLPVQIHPQPQLKRDAWISLDGEWEFEVTAGEKPKDYGRTIRAPFCPESLLSGIQEHFPEGSFLWYRTCFARPEKFNRGRVLLHIGAADQVLTCFLNGKAVGTHEGGYEAMTFDITEDLEDENEIVLSVRDDLRDHRYPYGKQTMKRGGMWYTPVSGIWQSVWLENVPERYIQTLDIESRGASVTIDTGDVSLTGTVTVKGLGEFPMTGGKVTITPEEPHFWSPEDPYLYEYSIAAGEDRVESYFALRTLEIREVDGVQRLCLNGKPYFFHGLLDQGYWSDGLFTPARPECWEREITTLKELGFNTLRKHIKVEPQLFYYYCDKLGMAVFQDMVNNDHYSFFRDTALPTIGIQKLPDKRLHRNKDSREMFLKGMETTVKQLKNHPCIVYWTIFNEGWGQFDGSEAYEKLRALDGTRFIDTTSGWFRGSRTDVDSRHVYFRKVKLKPGDQPLVLSEFGGIAYAVEDHVANPEKSYGYGSVSSREKFNGAFLRLYEQQIIPAVKNGLCAAIYTQVSDVEDEINGIFTYDRRVVKLDPELGQYVAQMLREAQ